MAPLAIIAGLVESLCPLCWELKVHDNMQPSGALEALGQPGADIEI